MEAAGCGLTRSQAILSVRTLDRIGLFGYPETMAGPSPLPYADALWKAPVTEIEPALRIARHREAIKVQLLPGTRTPH